MKKPNLFIGSSKENVGLARDAEEILEEDADSTVWDQGIFKLSKTTIESLVEAVERFDFALFVFAPDDVTNIRNKTHSTVRDNVIFELGLFTGHLGRERSFILAPRGIKNYHLPTDLLGVTIAQYGPKRDDDPLGALRVACNKVRRAMKSLRPRKRAQSNAVRDVRARRQGKRGAQSPFLAIHSAHWVAVADGKYVDVTERLIQLSSAGKLEVIANNDLLLHPVEDDPCRGGPKKLVVRYSCPYGSQIKSETVDERKKLILPK